jgi:hypothetical protein
MPAVVREYIERGTFEGSIDIQKQLVADYKEDIRKYANGMDQTRITNVFDHIPVQLAKDNKKFQITKVASNARFRDYRGCVDWLKDAGIINVCYCMQFPELPLWEIMMKRSIRSILRILAYWSPCSMMKHRKILG